MLQVAQAEYKTPRLVARAAENAVVEYIEAVDTEIDMAKSDLGLALTTKRSDGQVDEHAGTRARAAANKEGQPGNPHQKSDGPGA